MQRNDERQNFVKEMNQKRKTRGYISVFYVYKKLCWN